ncbi:Spy/CpxP family protein refolding chaperone [Pseudanabaena sp. 'Roaring Creek']|uniref:Spy/CpxP family protein refolding chaperone n=1 Tax=Pseudanabaena sp. 'Roaring Creek' TaxID=1681830 RepID=UPI0006D7E49B|nr:Spy/CpxP family protein refolding chaperone [Pseudanabaena sp. 'Roaring Creek']
MLNNFKRIFAVVMLSTSLGSITIPSIVSAQSNPDRGTPTSTQNHREGGWKKLNLSDAQKQQLKMIRASTAQKVQSVLTEEQRSKIATAKQSGDRKGVWKSLNLTADQKQQIHDIRKSSREQSLAVLTPDQRTQLQQMKSEHNR